MKHGGACVSQNTSVLSARLLRDRPTETEANHVKGVARRNWMSLQDARCVRQCGSSSSNSFPITRRCSSRGLNSAAKAAKAAGVQIEDGQRFGLHNLRHSLSNWLVNKAKVEPKTVQGILRHSRISDDAGSLYPGRQR